MIEKQILKYTQVPKLTALGQQRHEPLNQAKGFVFHIDNYAQSQIMTAEYFGYTTQTHYPIFFLNYSMNLS